MLPVVPHQGREPVPYKEGTDDEEGDEQVHQHEGTKRKEQRSVCVYGRGEELRDSVQLHSPYERHKEKSGQGNYCDRVYLEGPVPGQEHDDGDGQKDDCDPSEHRVVEERSRFGTVVDDLEKRISVYFDSNSSAVLKRQDGVFAGKFQFGIDTVGISTDILYQGVLDFDSGYEPDVVFSLYALYEVPFRAEVHVGEVFLGVSEVGYNAASPVCQRLEYHP